MTPAVRIAFAAALTALMPAPASAGDARDALWAAVRNADVAKVKAALDAGADVNAHNEMGITALWIAGGKENLEIVELLLKRGADPNARDGIWYQTPLSLAAGGGHPDLVTALLKAGAKDADAALVAAAGRGNLAVAEAILAAGKVRPEALSAALFAAPASADKLRAALAKAGAEPLKPVAEHDRAAWAKYAGTYENDNGGQVTVEVRDVGLVVRGGINSGQVFRPTGPDAFAPVGLESTTYTFERQ